MSMTAIPGTLSEEARQLRWVRIPSGAPEAGKAYIAQTHDGFLVAVLSQDPAGKNEKLLQHLSVSHRDKENRPDRCPTWDELKSAKFQLVTVDIPMVLIFPSKRVPYVNIYETCLHLWEAEGGIDE